ncbi:gluconate kinase [Lentibacillus kapialis]|uniref:Gluconate kinase n=1 Tax=Lentibacillus kapialis TaxID=340214 RepID=A0A917PSZ6_9BACI|nr:FGGY family carbohydrate kinase [Lentibacillus kapialis]GGJ91119.1 gluconate kinase [Lentibacillus kapialis]
MPYIAVFDIGTTSIKGVLLDQQGASHGVSSVLLDTHWGENGEIEQNPDDWWEGIKEIADKWWNVYGMDPDQIISMTFSGQMEDVIPIGNRRERAILYSDTRAGAEADWIRQTCPSLQDAIGNSIRASTPLAKLRWMQTHHPDVYQHASQFVFSAKDYIIYKLTGAVVTDPTTGATTGMMNLDTRQWEKDSICIAGVDPAKLPALVPSEETAGYVTKAAAEQTDFLAHTPVVCGSGDAGASTIGAGAVHQGDSYVYIGTTGWAAVVRDNVQSKESLDGMFHLAHLPENTVIAIAPLLNAGNVHRWAVQTFVGTAEAAHYEAFENMVQTSLPGSNGLIFLPYVYGERCPVHDRDAKGAFWGIGPTVAKHDFARAVMEGLSFSFKQIIDALTAGAAGTITLIGGGTRSASWCQMLADCIGRPVRVPADSEYMPAIGAAAAAFIASGWASDYRDFARNIIMPAAAAVYEPDQSRYEQYQEIYQCYMEMYPALRPIYHTYKQ